jgi:glycosyltransferase involved in cell wall biosynthesis
MNLTSFTTISFGLIVFGAFLIVLLVQLWYYTQLFSKLAYYKKAEVPKHTPPASIIICARNEDDNLVNFLPFVFEQNYPKFEVVVVNDCSSDNSADLLDELCKKYHNLKVVTIKESQNHAHGKKVALMMGIKGATYEHLLLTDADCKPNSKEWLRNMVQHLNGKTEIVLGYGAYQKQKGFLNKIIRFDTFMIALQYLSFALEGKTYMGIGRNLAYTKSLFFQMKAFASHYHIESGDDDLFVNEAATKHNSQIEINLDSHTISLPKKTIREWFRQKRRHITTFQHYNSASKRQLTTLSVSQYLFFTTFILLLAIKFEPIVVISLFGIRLITQLFVFSKSMVLLSEKDLLLFYPILELALLILYPIITFSNIFIKKNKWTN